MENHNETVDKLNALQAALDAFRLAGRALDLAWSDLEGDEIANYPAYLPSFDEFMWDVEQMVVCREGFKFPDDWHLSQLDDGDWLLTRDHGSLVVAKEPRVLDALDQGRRALFGETVRPITLPEAVNAAMSFKPHLHFKPEDMSKSDGLGS